MNIVPNRLTMKLMQTACALVLTVCAAGAIAAAETPPTLAGATLVTRSRPGS